MNMNDKETQIMNAQKGHIVAITSSTFEGSGMNCFLLNIALKWKKLGYRVTIICQDRKARSLNSVDSYIEGCFPKDTPKLRNGQLRVVIPDINFLIPIYTSSQYCEFPGIKSKAVQEMSQQQIQTNIQMSMNSLRAVVEHDRPLKVIANYMIMGGAICQRGLEGTGIPFDIIIPGPALQYSVKPYPHLWKWILPAFKKTQTIFPLTHFVQTQFLKCFKNHLQQYKIKQKTKIINPGVSIVNSTISLPFQECQRQFIQKISKLNKIPQVQIKINQQKIEQIQTTKQITKYMSPQQIHQILITNYKLNGQKNKIQQNWLKFSQQDETIIYAGALINNKGMGQLLAIAPKMIAERPTLKFIFCGTGPYMHHMNQFIKACANGNFQMAQLIAQAGEFITEVSVQDHFIKIDKRIGQRIIFYDIASSRQILQSLLPLCTLFVCPSRTLQSCRLNIIQAMLHGLTLICNDHSWYSQVLNVIQNCYPELSKVSRVHRLEFYEKLPETILNTLNFIKKTGLTKKQYKNKIRKIVIDNYSWEKTAKLLVTQFKKPQNQERNNIKDLQRQ